MVVVVVAKVGSMVDSLWSITFAWVTYFYLRY